MTVEAALFLWIVGVGLLAAELFVPGVVLGALGTVAVLVSIVSMFVVEGGGALWGGGLALASVAAAAVLVKVGAARLTHRHALSSEEGYAATDDHRDLVGKEGVTATVLRPAGFALIEGRRVDVVTGGELLEAGVPVVVVAAEGNRVQVRARDSGQPAPKSDNADA